MQPLPDNEERRPGGTERRSDSSAAGQFHYMPVGAQGAQHPSDSAERPLCVSISLYHGRPWLPVFVFDADDRLIDALNRNFTLYHGNLGRKAHRHGRWRGTSRSYMVHGGELWSWDKVEHTLRRLWVFTSSRQTGRPIRKSLFDWWMMHPRGPIRTERRAQGGAP